MNIDNEDSSTTGKRKIDQDGTNDKNSKKLSEINFNNLLVKDKSDSWKFFFSNKERKRVLMDVFWKIE
jgi:hypothetical protein